MTGSACAGRRRTRGSAVGALRAGDEVYGDNLALKGGFAEFAVVPDSALALKPSALTFAEAAAIPQAGAIALDNGGKLEFMRSLGADDVIDCRRDDFTRGADPYDLILDLVAHRSVFAYRRALARGGRYRCVGGSVRALLRIVTIGAIAGLATRRRLGVLAVAEGPSHFEPLTELCVSGDIRIHIDRIFGLDDVAGALAYVGEGRALGKVVVAAT